MNMAPRCGKRKYKVRNTIPVWLPLPRPCLRSLNMPGPPYYIPMSPEMYLPPWALPPPYFSKPMCHCANENFCTTNNCRNSTECLKTHPMFCPHGNKHEETADFQQNICDQQHDNDYQETSSNSDLNVCPACGAPPGKLKILNTKGDLQNNKSGINNTSKVSHTQDFVEHQVNQGPEHIHLEGKNVASTGRNIGENEIGSEFRHGSPETVLSKKHSKSTVNTSCQTACSTSRTRGNSRLTVPKRYDLNPPRRNRKSSESNYTEDSDTSLDKNITNLSNRHRVLNDNNMNEFGCTNCSQRKNSSASNSENVSAPISNIIHKDSVETTKESQADNIHVDQLPDHVSNARKRQASKYTGCCFSGSDKSCKASVEIDTMNKPIMEIPYSRSKSPKTSKFGCSSVNTRSKASSRTRKLADCICSSTKIPFKDKTRFRQTSNECSPNKTPYKPSSKSDKLSECGCSSTKITKKTKLRKVSECSCTSTELPHKASSRSRTKTEGEFAAEEIIPKACSSKLSTKKSNKTLNDLSVSTTNVKQTNCQCKFPPAYEHLSCTGNLSDNCSCNNNI